jgi:UDP-3-O-[3-hydroxymyristoyl] glucosamine N-acyltransferase
MFQHRLSDIAKHIGAEFDVSQDDMVSHIAALNEATESELSFIVDRKYLSQLKKTKAKAVIIPPALVSESPVTCLVMKNSYLGYAKAAELFQKPKSIKSGIHPTVIIGEDCVVADSVSIAPYVVIGDRVHLYDGVVIGAHTVIENDCILGKKTELKASVTICSDVHMGENCIVHSHTVIGSDGFGNAKDGAKWYKIPQLGGVRIGNNVEIGSNTSIDCGAMNHTIIEDGVRIDNLVQIAHNVHIGENTAIAGCSGIAGSTKIGKNCLLAGRVGVSGHIEICDNVVFTANSGVAQSVTEPGVYSSGIPVFKNAEWGRILVYFKHLDKLVKTVKKLEVGKQNIFVTLFIFVKNIFKRKKRG